ncbi:MAG TPA: carboxypeptidase regulatory-like domain-containing protein [Pyrinomonadaceae bacterium]
MRILTRFGASFCVCCALCFLVSAQQSITDISGTIKDPSGTPVPNATVEARNKNTGEVRQVTTDAEGRFVINVPPGIYELTIVAQAGFKEFKVENVTAAMGQSKALDITLTVGSVSEVVDVSSGYAPVELTWNVWAEPASPSPSFSPVKFLEPGGKNYSLILDLAAFAYSEGSEIYRTAVGRKLKDWLLKSKAPDTDLRLVIIPDERYFEPLTTSDRAKPLRVDLKRMRKALKKGVEITREPLEILRETTDVDFSFGRVSLNLRTRLREGLGAVAIALWSDGGIPIDELSIPVCVAREATSAQICDSDAPLQDSLSGIDPIRAAAQQDALGSRPDAALHFIALDSSTTVGVFRDNAWPEGKYINWTLNRSAEKTHEYLQKTLLPNFDRAGNEAELIPVGMELYNLLFPIPQAAEARAALGEFIRSHAGRADDTNPPSLFIRVLSNNSDDPPFLIPLGIMAFDRDGQKDFLGFHFRIQTPLPIQDYQPYTKCIGNWVVLAPPANVSGTPPELNTARLHFSDWYDKWKFQQLDEIHSLIKWAGEDVDEKTPASLFLLAHQDSNSLYFEDSPRLGAEGIQRRFKPPSVAIVNGCGTAAPGSSEIVQRLNLLQVSTIIATTASVQPHLAGDFFSVLVEHLTMKPAGKEYSLGVAHFLTLKKLRRTAPNGTTFPYGAKVLAYSLLGNSNVRVCSPPQK